MAGNLAHAELKDARTEGKPAKDNKDLSGRIAGNYRVLELIGEGGFGKTYKGEHIILKEPVCIKHAAYISQNDERILIEEARTMWDLRHYGIPAMRDLVKIDENLALIMSYIPGPTLEKIIEKAEKLDAENVAWIAERSLNVLKYLHYNGVIHGDVKPQNIIIQPASHGVVLVDFGLASVKPKNSTKSRGYTPYFSSPEQIRGDTLIPESDFYSLGMTMIYALGGDIATKGIPSQTPEEFSSFIKRLIVRDPISRPNWEKEDLVETLQSIREKSFGRRHSYMKPLPSTER